MTFSTADTVTTTLYYFSPPKDGSVPYVLINSDAATGPPKRNWEQVPHEVQIENIRGKEETVSLDTTGFQFFRRPAQHKTFENDGIIEKEYYTEQTELIKELTGASRAVIFNHTLRRSTGETKNTPRQRPPVSQVHVDKTPESSAACVRLHLPAEEHLLEGRYQIINLWRPISHPAYDWPLALCDYRSVDRANDLVASTLKYPDRDDQTFALKFNPDHKWKYLKGMDPDDLILIKCFDSKDDGVTANFAPHTAFADPSSPKDAPLRESIELRFLVFYD